MPKKSNRTQSKKTAPPAQSKLASPGNMRWIAIATVVVLAVVGMVAVLIFSNKPAGSTAGLAPLPDEINVSQAHELYQQGVFLLDVRTQDEWDEVHVPNATLIPLDQLESRLNEVPRDLEIVVMCRSGNRSQTGRDILRNAGFENVTSMVGGIRDWSAAGYPTIP